MSLVEVYIDRDYYEIFSPLYHEIKPQYQIFSPFYHFMTPTMPAWLPFIAAEDLEVKIPLRVFYLLGYPPRDIVDK